MKKPTVGEGLIAGVIGGLVGTYAMGWASKAWTEAQKTFGESGSGSESNDEPATVKAAEIVSQSLRDRGLAKDEKDAAGQMVHYAMGATTGAIYGVSSSLLPITTIGQGVPFGLAVFAIADEMLVPLAGLSEPPGEIPAEVHARGLVAHLVYGFVTDVTRRIVLVLID